MLQSRKSVIAVIFQWFSVKSTVWSSVLCAHAKLLNYIFLSSVFVHYFEQKLFFFNLTIYSILYQSIKGRKNIYKLYCKLCAMCFNKQEVNKKKKVVRKEEKNAILNLLNVLCVSTNAKCFYINLCCIGYCKYLLKFERIFNFKQTNWMNKVQFILYSWSSRCYPTHTMDFVVVHSFAIQMEYKCNTLRNGFLIYLSLYCLLSLSKTSCDCSFMLVKKKWKSSAPLIADSVQYNLYSEIWKIEINEVYNIHKTYFTN